MIDNNEGFKKVKRLIDTKAKIEKFIDGKLTYHGLKDLNDDGYPYFVQWNHKFPIIVISNETQSTLIGLPMEIGFAIEKMLGNVDSEHDFKLQIETAFKRKESKMVKK